MIENNATNQIAVQETLTHKSIGMDVYPRQAWRFSVDEKAAYLQARADNSMALSPLQASYLAVARLDWLLVSTRATLSGIFTSEDLSMLLNCFQGEVFFPKQIDTIAEALCDDQGIGSGEVDGSHIAPLVQKLLALTLAQSMALADVLEQTWYVGLKQQVAPAAFLQSLGIELADD
jgi:hypothetical protein